MNPNAKILCLKNIGSIAAGHPVRGSVEDLPKGSVAMLQMRDIDVERGIVWSSAAKIDPPGKRSPDYVQSGDVIFTSRGARNIAVAAMAIDREAICGPNLFLIRIRDRGQCDPRYLAWYINQRPCQTYLQREATGTNILNIRREVVENIAIPMPSLARQESIIDFDRSARLEQKLLRDLIVNREQQMEALAVGLAQGEEN